MKRNEASPDGRTDRRTFLGFLGVAAAGTLALPRATAADSDTRVTLQQGDRCLSVTPLSHGDQSVEEFYGYSTEDYESHTATDLERSDVSQLFLYEDPDGRLSLAIVHDVAEGPDGTGGAASFEFAGLAADGEWLVRNDDYDGADDVWETTENHESDAVHWAWNNWHSDGGVFGGLDAEFEVTITPAFNEAARLDPGTPGEITEWQFLSGDAADPERIALSLDDPLTLTTGTCSKPVEGRVEADLVVDSDDALVNLRSHGRLPVAVTSSETLDATTVDPDTVRFGPAGAEAVHATHADVDGDGRPDLLVHFEVDDIGLDEDTTSVTLTGETTDGRTVTASASIDVVDARKETERRDCDEEDEEREDRCEDEEDEKGAEEDEEKEADEDEEDEEREYCDEKAEKRERKREKKREKREKRERKREKQREKRERKDAKRERKRGKGHERKNGKGHDRGKGRGHEDEGSLIDLEISLDREA